VNELGVGGCTLPRLKIDEERDFWQMGPAGKYLVGAEIPAAPVQATGGDLVRKTLKILNCLVTQRKRNAY